MISGVAASGVATKVVSGVAITGLGGRGRGGKTEKSYQSYTHLGMGWHRLPHGVLAGSLLEEIA